ncbi:MAG: hypothetical protein ABIN01_19905 [Ferruginibacter sp.]
MKPSKILLAATAGTTAMTVYSYTLAEIKSENFKEPQLLAQLLSTIDRPLNRTSASITGWAIHYLVGLIFTLFYERMVKSAGENSIIKQGIMMGSVNGVIAMIGWQITRRIHPSPPQIAYKKFFGQLFIAHVVFGIVTTLFLKKYLQPLS